MPRETVHLLNKFGIKGAMYKKEYEIPCFERNIAEKNTSFRKKKKYTHIENYLNRRNVK